MLQPYEVGLVAQLGIQVRTSLRLFWALTFSLGNGAICITYTWKVYTELSVGSFGNL